MVHRFVNTSRPSRINSIYQELTLTASVSICVLSKLLICSFLVSDGLLRTNIFRLMIDMQCCIFQSSTPIVIEVVLVSPTQLASRLLGPHYPAVVETADLLPEYGKRGK
jgi:hypothetical protein